MAYAKISVTNGMEVKEVPIGYSWTVLFFGFFPPVFRGDWQWAIILFVCNLLTYGIFGAVVSFLYNKIYLKNLFNRGYWIHTMDPQLTEDAIKSYVGFLNLPTNKK
jgi:hypothetical protein